MSKIGISIPKKQGIWYFSFMSYMCWPDGDIQSRNMSPY